MSKGCNNCKNYQIGTLLVWSADIPSSCKLGFTEEFESWWRINGAKKPEDGTDMDCFEDTNLGKILNKVSGILDELKLNNSKS